MIIQHDDTHLFGKRIIHKRTYVSYILLQFTEYYTLAHVTQSIVFVLTVGTTYGNAPTL